MENQIVKSDVVIKSEDGNSHPSDATSQIPKPTSLSREVSFSSIEIREYPLCMGDNPGCLRGVPITIEWTHTSERSLSLKEYEQARGEPNYPIAIPPHKRFEMLMKTKLYTRGEIMKQLQKVENDRERRALSTSDSEKFEENIERLKRGFLNKTFRRKSKQKEKELLLPFLSPTSVNKGRLRRTYSISSTTSCESNSLEDDPLCKIAREVDVQQSKIET